jgi:hypothetical protein
MKDYIIFGIIVSIIVLVVLYFTSIREVVCEQKGGMLVRTIVGYSCIKVEKVNK